MTLSERQQKAQALSRELGKFDGTWVVNPMPLQDDARGLRIQVLECDRNKVFQAIQDWGYQEPAFVSMTPRVTPVGMTLACVYEIALPRERQVVVDTTIRGEISTGNRIQRLLKFNART